MSPRRSARRSWHDLFGSDADASPPNPEGIEACRRRTPVTHGRPSDEKKGAKPSQPPPPPVPKNLPLSHPPSEAKNLSGNSQVGREAGKKRKPAPTRESERPGEKRKPAPFERAWSTADELRILTALSKHAESHGDDLPEPSDLFAALAGSFDNWGADADKLADKVRKLRRRHGKARLQGCPGDDHGRRMFELYDKVWGHGASHGSGRGDVVTLRRSPRKCNKRGHVHVVAQEANQEGGDEGHAPTRTPGGNWGFAKHVPQQPGRAAVDIGACQDIPVQLSEDGDVNSRRSKDNGGRVEEDRQVKATYVRRHFNELSRLYPYLAQEVKGYTDTHSSGELIMVAFQTIGDEEARNLDARCKKQRIDRLNLEMSQADITKALLCTLAGRIN